MHARSSGSPSASVRDRLRLEWEVGLQRLPFFTQRLAVALLGLLVVSLALVGGMAILQGGQQGSDVQLRPPPELGQPSASTGPELIGPAAPVQGVAGGGTGQGAGEAMSAPVGARSAPSSTGQAGAGAGSGPGSTARPAPGGAGQQAPPTTTAPTTSTATSDEPTTSDGGILGPLPPVLSNLLN